MVLAVILGLAGYRFFSREEVRLPIGGEAREETVKIERRESNLPGEIITEKEEGGPLTTERKIMVTNGVKHSVPLEEIRSGGPPKDGIPSIDNPKFISISEANQWLQDTEPGIAFSRGSTNRFYPYQILVWHEIVNDTVDGERILVTYCPLCFSGFVFDPVVKGERVEFGTSGQLWKSNLVMYDRKTDSLWSQILGEAVVGEMTGTKLKILPSDLIRYGEWKKKFPQGQVLSRDTGAIRFYGSNPYGDYFAPVDFAISIAGSHDARLAPEAFIYGVVINEKPKAYLVETVKEKGEVEDEFQGIKILLRHEKDLDVVRMWRVKADGTLERINPFSAFWFSWAAAHPDTEIYK